VVLVIHHRSGGCHLPQRGVVHDATGKASFELNAARLAAEVKRKNKGHMPESAGHPSNIGAHL